MSDRLHSSRQYLWLRRKPDKVRMLVAVPFAAMITMAIILVALVVGWFGFRLGENIIKAVGISQFLIVVSQIVPRSGERIALAILLLYVALTGLAIMLPLWWSVGTWDAFFIMMVATLTSIPYTINALLKRRKELQ